MSDFDAALTRLDDYVRGHQDDASAQAYEEELFARALDGSAPEAGFHSGLGTTLRAMNGRGTLDLWITARDVERMRASGLNTVLYEWAPGKVPEIPADADLLIARIPLPLEGVRSIDAELYSVDGRLLKRMPDVLFDPADGAVFACCEADLARQAANSVRTLTKLWVVTDGERRLLADLSL